MSAQSIVSGVNRVIDEALGLTGGLGHHHKKACQRLSKEPPLAFDGESLIRDMLAQIRANWDQRNSRSKENWRWEKKPDHDPKNCSLEVKLERKIVKSTDADWVNQVPIASGLTASAGGRRAIDLVHRCGDGWYEFIELKVNGRAGTPLFAAMEILQYGALYMFSRENAQALGYERTGMLGARGIHLKVAAPAEYYKSYDLAWLEPRLNAGLDQFLARGARDFAMDFKFESLEMRLRPLFSPVSWSA